VEFLSGEVCQAKKIGRYARRKRRPFITWGQSQPLLCNLGYLNGESQLKDCNPTTSPQYFILGFVLIFFYIPSCFCPKHHSSNRRRHGPNQWALTSPLNGHIFCKEEISQIQGYRWIHKAPIVQGDLFPQKMLQIWSLFRNLIHGAFPLAICTT
jgi:hypothetical protein